LNLKTIIDFDICLTKVKLDLTVKIDFNLKLKIICLNLELIFTLLISSVCLNLPFNLFSNDHIKT